MIEKGRPVLVLAYPESDDARALVIVAPLTSQIRGSRGEVDIGRPKWLPKPSTVNIQGMASFDRHKLRRKFGKLTSGEFERVKDAIRRYLDL